MGLCIVFGIGLEAGTGASIGLDARPHDRHAYWRTDAPAIPFGITAPVFRK